MENGNNPTFPRLSDDYIPERMGLTKREYFAGLAMQGVLSHRHPQTPTPNQHDDIAELAVKISDALLKELDGGNHDN